VQTHTTPRVPIRELRAQLTNEKETEQPKQSSAGTTTERQSDRMINEVSDDLENADSDDEFYEFGQDEDGRPLIGRISNNHRAAGR